MLLCVCKAETPRGLPRARIYTSNVDVAFARAGFGALRSAPPHATQFHALLVLQYRPRRPWLRRLPHPLAPAVGRV